jgi:sugar O-acyltransferase (sialic acid O-acetyltransferase NeuD family)
MTKKLLLFPFGGNAREALVTIFAINAVKQEWDVIGFLDDDQSLRGKDYLGVKVLGGTELLQECSDAYVLAVPGSPKGYLRRKTILEGLAIEQSRFATIIHPSVVSAPDAAIGYNSIIMPHVVISCSVRIGNHCIILPNTVIAHDGIVGDYCCVGSNVSISGTVTVGPECYIGSGTKVRENISIGGRTLVGLGSNVISPIEQDAVAVGNPARVIKRHNRGNVLFPSSPA